MPKVASKQHFRKLRGLITEQGLTIQEVAEMAHVSYGALKNLLAAKTVWTTDFMLAVARVLNIPFGDWKYYFWEEVPEI